MRMDDSRMKIANENGFFWLIQIFGCEPNGSEEKKS